MNTKSKVIRVLTFQTHADFEQRRGCVTDFDYDTIKDAKHHAKLALTDDYARSNEMSNPLEYAQVTVNDEVIYDFFRKASL